MILAPVVCLKCCFDSYVSPNFRFNKFRRCRPQWQQMRVGVHDSTTRKRLDRNVSGLMRQKLNVLEGVRSVTSGPDEQHFSHQLVTWSWSVLGSRSRTVIRSTPASFTSERLRKVSRRASKPRLDSVEMPWRDLKNRLVWKNGKNKKSVRGQTLFLHHCGLMETWTLSDFISFQPYEDELLFRDLWGFFVRNGSHQ